MADGEITEKEYMEKLEGFVARMTDKVKNLNNQNQLWAYFDQAASNYKTKKGKA